MPITLNGTTGIVSPSVTGTPVIGGLVSGAAVSASGTSVDFTGIPSWVKRVTVLLSGFSTNGGSLPTLRLGDSGGIETSGYAGDVHIFGTGLAGSNFSTGFDFSPASNWGAGYIAHGTLVLHNISGNVWVLSGTIGVSSQAAIFLMAGSKTLSDTLTQVRITTVNGTDTFDAGTINIMYEG